MRRVWVHVAPVVLGSLFGALEGLAAQEARVSGSVGGRGTTMSGAVVSLYALDGSAPPAPRSAEIDQLHLGFVPSVLVVSPGSLVRFTNSDPLMHNVFGPGIRGGDRFDLGTYPRGNYAVRTFDRAGVHVVLCHIHPELVAYVVVTDAAFHTVTGGDGQFRIPDVPPGRYRLTVWHPRLRGGGTTLEIRVPAEGLDGLYVELTESSAVALGGS